MGKKRTFLSVDILNEKYKKITSYQKQIRDFLLKENAVESYLNTINISKEISESYRSNYKKFYGLRLSDDLAEAYFNKLIKVNKAFDKRKNAEYKDVEKMISELRDISFVSEGKAVNHFSFSTKLIHTVNHNFPIYDQEVGKFFLYEISCKNRPSMTLEKFNQFYNALIAEYRRIKNDSCLQGIIGSFDKEIKGFKEISFEKKVDFIIWRYQTIVDKEVNR